MDEIEIYLLEGAQFTSGATKKAITAWISFTGMMTDIYDMTFLLRAIGIQARIRELQRKTSQDAKVEENIEKLESTEEAHCITEATEKVLKNCEVNPQSM